MLKSKLNTKHVFQAINTWVVPTIRYGAGIIEWTKEEGKEMDQKTMRLSPCVVGYTGDQTFGGCAYEEVKEVGGS